MPKGKSKELLISTYIVKNSNLLLNESLKDIEIKENGTVVELWLYYSISSKYDLRKIKKEIFKEPQFVYTTAKRGMYCAKFLAPRKMKDLILCKLYAAKQNDCIDKLLG